MKPRKGRTYPTVQLETVSFCPTILVQTFLSIQRLLQTTWVWFESFNSLPELKNKA